MIITSSSSSLSLTHQAARRCLGLSCRRRQQRVPPTLRFTKRTHYESSSGPSSSSSTTSSGTSSQQIPEHDIPAPSSKQLRRLAMYSSLPMVGFGIMDQTIMIHAGNAIDCTIGVTLGLSTLAAAAVGQIVANAGGILFGETLQHFFTSKFSLVPPSNLSAAQMSLASVSRAKLAGTFWGLVFGCTVGLLNLLLIDTERSTNLKMIQALNEEGEDVSKKEFAFEIDVHNDHSKEHDSYVTTLTIRGPDTDGILANLVTALTEENLSLVELNARPVKRDDGHVFEDVFVLKRNGEAIPDDELDELANKMWQATRSPLNVPTLSARLKESESRNQELEKRIERLTDVIKERQVKATKANSKRNANVEATTTKDDDQKK